MKFNKFAPQLWKNFLDLLLPLNRARQFVDKLTPQEFMREVGPPLRFSENRDELPSVQNIIALVSYRNKIVKQAVWSLKFQNNRNIAKLFAEIIYDTLAEELADLKLADNFNRPILTPIPLSRKRLRERGYNQSELIASQLAKIDQNNFFEYQPRILKKIKDTRPQSRSKTKAERIKNLKNCFQVVNPDTVKNRNIILLDDVITTGATLAEASRVLRRAGARQILPVTFAH